MSPRRPRSRPLVVLTAMILLGSMAGLHGTAVAADDEATDAWKKLFGKELKLKGDPVVYTDATGDAIDVATGQQVGGPGYADATDFAILTTTLKKPQVNALRKKQQAKKTQQILGNDADPKAGQTWMFAGIRTVDRLPPGVPGGVQLNVAFDGVDAVPLYPGSALDAIAGNEILTIAGQYDGFDPLLTGTTKLVGTPPGERPGEYNNAPARASGFVQGDVWFIGQPVPKGANAVGFTFQTIDDSMQLLDRLTTPGGLDQFPLAGTMIPDDLCYSGIAFAALDASGEPTQYQVELAIEMSQPLEAGDLADFTFRTVGDDPQPVPGGWQVFPEINSAFGNFIAEPGQIQIALDTWQVPDDALGVDAATLRDGAVVELRGNRSGQLFGRPCGLLEPVEGGIPESAGETLATHVGLDPAELEQFDFDSPDDADVRVVVDPAAEQAIAVLTAGNRPSSVQDFERRASTSFCEVTDVDLGEQGILAVCPDGTRRLFWIDLFQGDAGPLDFGRIFSAEVLPRGFPADGPAPEELIPADAALPDALTDVAVQLQDPYMEILPFVAP